MNQLTNEPIFTSGRRGSNSRPIAWKAIALPTELLPLLSTVALAKVVFYPTQQSLWFLSQPSQKASANEVGGEGFEPSKPK
jgi:hypothetical protein